MGGKSHAINEAVQHRIDPIEENYFKSLERADKASGFLFWIGAGLTFLALLFDPITYPKLHLIASYFSLLVIVVFFVVNITMRLHLFPRAEDARRKDSLSNIFGIDLTTQRTKGYYNNEAVTPEHRMGLVLLENLLFTKTILQRMAVFERTKAALCLLIWVVFLLYRESTLIVITAIALTLFSEDILAKWLRLEWARDRAEKLFESTYRILQSNPSKDKLFPYIIDAYSDYETGKALGGILLSSKIFNKLNPSLTKEWDSIKNSLTR